MMQKTALIVGSTGLVGSHLLEQLLEDQNYSLVRSVSRRSSGISHPKLEEIIISLDDLDKNKDKIKADDIFCCLGTTIAKAGSRSVFEKVDFGYPLKIAKISKSNKASRFTIVTAMGANKNSIFFYNRVKGKVEEEIGEIDFDFYTIVRPSMILGERKEKRSLEVISKVIMEGLGFLFIGPMKKLKPVHSIEIARTMRATAVLNDKKFRIVPSNEIGQFPT